MGGLCNVSQEWGVDFYFEIGSFLNRGPALFPVNCWSEVQSGVVLLGRRELLHSLI